MNILAGINSYFIFLWDFGSTAFSAAGIWCAYEKLGLRIIMMLVSTGIIAFAIPNLLDKSECRPDRDSYIKVHFTECHARMKWLSGCMLLTAALTIYTYLCLLFSIHPEHLCGPSTKLPTDSNIVFSIPLLLFNIGSCVLAFFALRYKIYCFKHKQ